MYKTTQELPEEYAINIDNIENGKVTFYDINEKLHNVKMHTDKNGFITINYKNGTYYIRQKSNNDVHGIYYVAYRRIGNIIVSYTKDSFYLADTKIMYAYGFLRHN